MAIDLIKRKPGRPKKNQQFEGQNRDLLQELIKSQECEIEYWKAETEHFKNELEYAAKQLYQLNGNVQDNPINFILRTCEEMKQMFYQRASETGEITTEDINYHFSLLYRILDKKYKVFSK